MNKKIKVSDFQSSSILVVYTFRNKIDVNPEYQRVSEVWTKEKRQLLLDSIINGFDIPKIYFHEFNETKIIDEKNYDYAIVDGKQRLETIWQFIDGNLELSKDFLYYDDESIKLEGLTYSELAEKYPTLKQKFDGTVLPIKNIETKNDEIELIEEMFSRLNEAVPLNAPEKRNAFGGQVPKLIKKISKHEVFKVKIPFPDKRYRYLDVAVKFLFLESHYPRTDSKKTDSKKTDSKRAYDTKKIFLDDFTKHPNKYIGNKTLAEIESQTKLVLDEMSKVFVAKDKLLKSTGMLSVYYLLFKEFGNKVKRSELENFEKLREENKAKIKTDEDQVNADYELLEFDRLAWSPNDSGSILLRYGVLKSRLFPTDPTD